jgi:WD40 repeat protein
MSDDAVDVFISYADADRWWVEGYLLDSLVNAGIRCHSDAIFRLGVPRIDEFQQAIERAKRTLLVLSPAFFADDSTQLLKRLVQQFGSDSRTWPVIPLRFRPVERLEPSLAMLVGLDATDESSWPEVVTRLCAELKRPVPAVAPRPPSPYPGMRSFRTDEESAFFGRDGEVRALIEQHLRLHPFVAVVGPSGTGKSSLVFAGLIPELRRSTLFGPGGWLVKSMRPGPQPYDMLVATLGGDASGPEIAAARLMAARPDGERLLLVVDQFEELYTGAVTDAEASNRFVDALLRVAAVPSCFVVITVRADYYGDVMQTPALWQQVRAHRLELTPMDADGLRAAIVRPAERAGVLIEPALVERLLADAGNEPGILPFLQETLVLLWQRLERRSLASTSYDAMVMQARRSASGFHAFRSGLQVAMASRADQAMSTLPSDEARATARRILLRLVQFGEGRSDARRQQTVGELRVAGEDPELFASTLRHLIDARLLTTAGGEGRAADERLVDLAHEALLTGWPALAEWIAQRREAEQMRRWLRDVAERWLRRTDGGMQGGLLDEVELMEAERWRDRYGSLVGRDAEIEQLIDQSRAYAARLQREREEQQQREIEQQRMLAEEQRLRAEDAERFGAEQRELNIELAALNREVSRTAASSSFVQAIGFADNDRGDRAIARLVQTLRLDPSHDAAARALFVLLANRWHPRLLGTRELGQKILETCYTPDGSRIICRSSRKTYVWRAGDDACEVLVLEHPSFARSIRVSSDSRRLLTSSTTYGEMFGPEAHAATGTIEVWDLESGARLHSADVPGMVLQAIWARGESRVFVASAYGPVALTESLQRAAETWPESIDGASYRTDNTPSLIAFHEETHRIAWVGSPHFIGQGELYLWDGETEQLLHRGEQPGFASFVFTADGNSAAFSGPIWPEGMKGLGRRPDGFAGIMSVDPPEIRVVVRHDDLITSMHLNAAETRAVSISEDRVVRLWAPQDGEILAELEHESPVTAAAFGPAGHLLVTGTQAGGMRIWDGWRGNPLSENVWHDAAVTSVAFEPAGREFTVTLASGRVCRYDAASTAARHGVLETGKPRMQSCTFISETDSRVVVRSDDRLEVWDTLAGAQVSEFLVGNNEARIDGICAERDLIAVRDGNVARVFELAAGQQVTEIEFDTKVEQVTFAAGGRRLITISGHRAALTALGGGASLTLDHNDSVVAVRHLNDGRLLTATAVSLQLWSGGGELLKEARPTVSSSSRFVGADGSVAEREEHLPIAEAIVDEQTNRILVLYGHRGAFVGQPQYKEQFLIENAQLWTLDTLAEAAPPMGDGDFDPAALYPINNAVLVAQASRVVTTNNVGSVRIWDLVTGEGVGGPLQHQYPTHDAVPSPDATMVAVYGRASPEVNLWSLKSGDPVGRPLIHDAGVIAVRFAGRSNVVITWTAAGTVRQWDAATGLQIPGVIATGRGVRSTDSGMAGDLIVTVNDPGVASIHRIGYSSAAALPTMLDFAEARSGWTVSPYGIEVRKSFAVPAWVADPSEVWQRFLQWSAQPPAQRPAFPGASVFPHEINDSILALGPMALAYVVLQSDPGNAEALMQLAETVAANDEHEVNILAGLAGVSKVEDLAALGRAWANLSVRAATNPRDYEKRRKRALEAIEQAEGV